MSLKQNDVCYEQLQEWLEEYGATTNDVLTNQDGEKFIMVESENGTAGEDGYDIFFKRVLLPRQFQELN